MTSSSTLAGGQRTRRFAGLGGSNPQKKDLWLELQELTAQKRYSAESPTAEITETDHSYIDISSEFVANVLEEIHYSWQKF